MRLLALASIVVLASCASGPGPEEGARASDLAKLEIKLAQYQDKSLNFSTELAGRVSNLERKVDQQRDVIDVLQVDIKRLRSEMDGLKGGSASPSPSPNATPDPTASPLPPAPATEDALIRADAALAALRKGATDDKVAGDLLSIADVAAPRLFEAVGANMTDQKLVTAIEKVLARLPVKALAGPIREALKDGVRRSSAARIVGSIKDRDLSKLLEPYTADPDDDFCVLAGSAMVFCRNKYGVPALLKALKSGQKETRFLAVAALRPLSRDAFGFDFSQPPDRNAEAIRKWEEWWDRTKAKLFE